MDPGGTMVPWSSTKMVAMLFNENGGHALQHLDLVSLEKNQNF